MSRLKVLVQILFASSMLFAWEANAGAGGKIAGEIAEEVVERAARRSGRAVVGQATRQAANETLERLARTYGDDVLKVAAKASPQARRAFARNIPELLSLVRRVGPEALELEAKSPGLAVRVFGTFGDDAGRALAKSVPAEDIPRLLGYAERADSPAARKALVEAYGREGKTLFERIPPKLVLASGLSASMLYGTHALTGPVRAAAEAIEDSPEVADTAVRQFAAWGGGVFVAVVFVLLWRFRLMPWHCHRSRKAARPPSDVTPGSHENGRRIAG